MGIRKWMTFNNRMRRLISSGTRKGGIPLLAVVLMAPPAAAEAKTFNLMVAPGVVVPAGNGLYLPAPAASFVLDFLPRKNIPIFVQGEYTSVSVKSVDPIQLFDGSLGMGLVKRFNDRLSLRGDLFAGMYAAQRKSEDAPVNISGISAGARALLMWRVNPVISAGLQATFRHYAYTPEPFLNGFGAGLAVSLNLNELFGGKARIETVKERQDPVFPVFYSRYQSEDFAMVRVTNREDAAITDVSASFYLEQYMGQPELCVTIPRLAPGESAEVPLRAFFDSSMLELNEKIDAESRFIVKYRVLGSERESNSSLTIPVYNRNAMSWDDDRRAAAFVSARDPAALWFAKYVSSAVNQDFRNGLNHNLQYAMGIFDSLRAYGLNYVVDPASAYADNVGSSASIDFLQYPYQTLMYRGGDCDDISILWCSLLEAIDVESAFVTIPGHIFIAFSTGLDEATARTQFSDPSGFVIREGKAWIPLEITLTKEDFNKAWRIGAKEWRDADARSSANFYPVRDAWKLFPPVSIPGAASRFTLPDENKTLASFNKTLDAFVAREIKGQVDAFRKKLAARDSADVRNELGILYARYGILDKARPEFERSSALGSDHAVVNLGNLSFLAGDYETALSTYSGALKKDSANKLAMLGAARSCYELDDFETSDGLYGMLVELDPELAKKYSYLNSFFDTTGRAWSLSDRLETTLWSVPAAETGYYVAAIPPEAGTANTAAGTANAGTKETKNGALANAPSVRDLTNLSARAEEPTAPPVEPAELAVEPAAAAEAPVETAAAAVEPVALVEPVAIAEAPVAVPQDNAAEITIAATDEPAVVETVEIATDEPRADKTAPIETPTINIEIDAVEPIPEADVLAEVAQPPAVVAETPVVDGVETVETPRAAVEPDAVAESVPQNDLKADTVNLYPEFAKLEPESEVADAPVESVPQTADNIELADTDKIAETEQVAAVSDSAVEASEVAGLDAPAVVTPAVVTPEVVVPLPVAQVAPVVPVVPAATGLAGQLKIDKTETDSGNALSKLLATIDTEKASPEVLESESPATVAKENAPVVTVEEPAPEPAVAEPAVAEVAVAEVAVAEVALADASLDEAAFAESAVELAPEPEPAVESVAGPVAETVEVVTASEPVEETIRDTVAIHEAAAPVIPEAPVPVIVAEVVPAAESLTGNPLEAQNAPGIVMADVPAEKPADAIEVLPVEMPTEPTSSEVLVPEPKLPVGGDVIALPPTPAQLEVILSPEPEKDLPAPMPVKESPVSAPEIAQPAPAPEKPQLAPLESLEVPSEPIVPQTTVPLAIVPEIDSTESSGQNGNPYGLVAFLAATLAALGALGAAISHSLSSKKTRSPGKKDKV